ncbi:DUF4433 domain-containing protein [Marinobacter bryozoorum]|uniref:type II toxin-antitoxin system toxin DNA ADP-ribosyl transferase DarT n=1 Tax=Marinobacter bryozoorum TaxID=256324 RepID=UPI0020060EAF|nr:DUF4433 domain-containing protein [Marinobacter bryozoorum]MCK7545182.1 DUF4433 domain-containing protein [Marinobacter bryozoorum]
MGFEKDLTPEKALIFRITHRRNLPWVFDNGIHCRSSVQQDQGFVSIGNQELIEGRKERTVPMEPSGVLSDYIPFYFTPYSPMLLNIVTGRNVPQRLKADIVILVSSLHKVNEAGIRFLFTDRHAYLFNASFSNDLNQLANMVPWELLQARDFRKDPEDPAKSERYQAEALIHRHLPVDALLGVVTYNDRIKAEVQALAAERQLNLGIHSKPSWFF